MLKNALVRAPQGQEDLGKQVLGMCDVSERLFQQIRTRNPPSFVGSQVHAQAASSFSSDRF
jgi:hypothetical protein